MKILCNDIGTGTQDVLLVDTRLDLENAFKLIVPSPTLILHHRMKRAADKRRSVVLTGSIMGGGPSQWGAEAVIQAGGSVFATPEAAATFNDDLSMVSASGITLIEEQEVERLPDEVIRLKMSDFDLESLSTAFSTFDVSLNDLDAIIVGVFDHGNAPAGTSDRQFRFDYLDEMISSRNSLCSFAFPAGSIPASMTRLQAVAQSAAEAGVPVYVMDTAPAAILGAMQDPNIGFQDRRIVVNIGNFHCLAFRIGSGGIEGLFEHHTGLLERSALERLLRSLAAGTLSREEVFNDHGHGSLMFNTTPLDTSRGPYDVAVTGPRRSMLKGSELRVYSATPHGDMMFAGCYGMLMALADILGKEGQEIRDRLLGKGAFIAPWDLG